jgi:hypothetical protein
MKIPYYYKMSLVTLLVACVSITFSRAEVTTSQIGNFNKSIVRDLSIADGEFIEKYGIIDQDETWSGTIYIAGDIEVKEGVTLTIMPGTAILVAANSDKNNLFGHWECEGIDDFDMLQGINDQWENKCGVHRGEPFRDEGNHISIKVFGTLLAVGEPNNRITIKSDAVDPKIYDWNRLEFGNGILSYTIMEYYRILETREGGSAEVSNNVLRNIGECGVCANSSNARIISNEISYAGHELIDMHLNSPTIKNNTLGPNPEHAGIIIDGGNPLIKNNDMIGGGVHFIDVEGISSNTNITYNTFEEEAQIILGCSQATIEQNNILSYVSADGIGCKTNSIDATHNYWGTTNEDEIGDKITDRTDNEQLREVIYKPFLDTRVVPNFVQLNAAVDPVDGGTLTGQDIDCPPFCTEIYVESANVSLKATPSSNYQFDYWSGDCEGTDALCNLTMNNATKVTAHFILSAISSTTTSTTTPTTTSTTTSIPCTANVIYGAHSEETEILRYIRDKVLAQTSEGQEVIKLYYQWTPSIVQAMEADEAYKEEVKEMVAGVLELIGGSGE